MLVIKVVDTQNLFIMCPLTQTPNSLFPLKTHSTVPSDSEPKKTAISVNSNI